MTPSPTLSPILSPTLSLPFAYPLAYPFAVCCTRCGNGAHTLTPRGECQSFLAWFWFNLLVDLFFIADIVVNFRTGYIRCGSRCSSKAGLTHACIHISPNEVL